MVWDLVLPETQTVVDSRATNRCVHLQFAVSGWSAIHFSLFCAMEVSSMLVVKTIAYYMYVPGIQYSTADVLCF